MVNYKDLGLVNTREMFAKAIKGGYAIPAFNFNNMEQMQAIVAACVETKSPVILQVSSGARKYANQTILRYMAQGAVEYAKELGCNIPICLHLDHGDTYELSVSCIEMGFSSVMIDGSELPIEENIAITKKVVAAAHACGVSVEAEIGHVGGRGDDAVKEDVYTTVEEAKTFYEQTDVDMLAVSIGTTHGVYLKKPELKFDRITELNEAIPIPLVMHGGSGLTKEDYIEVSKRGISKINFATYMFLAGGQAIEDKVNDAAGKKAEFNSLLKAGFEGQKQIVKEHIGYFGTEKWNKK